MNLNRTDWIFELEKRTNNSPNKRLIGETLIKLIREDADNPKMTYRAMLLDLICTLNEMKNKEAQRLFSLKALKEMEKGDKN